MKKLLKLSYIIITTIFICCILFGCYNIDKDKYIELYDYKTIEIAKSYLELSEEEIDTIIYMDFISNDYYKKTEKNIVAIGDIVSIDVDSEISKYCCSNYFYEVGSNDINDAFDNLLVGQKPNTNIKTTLPIENKMVKMDVYVNGIYILNDTKDKDVINAFYGFKTYDDSISYIKNRAAEEITFNYMWNIIIEKSKLIAFPESINIRINQSINEIVEIAQKSNQSIEDFLTAQGTSLSDIKQDLYDYNYEILLAETILSKENKIIDDNLLKKYTRELSRKNNVSEEEVLNYFTNEEIYYFAIMEELRVVLLLYAIIK